MKSYPSPDRVKESVVEVFQRASDVCGASILGALVPHSSKPARMICTFPDQEAEELCRFVNQFKGYVSTTDDPRELTRLRVLIYCHIMEAELPPAIIWNLLRLIDGQGPAWDFVGVNKKRKEFPCELPEKRYDEIQRIAKKVGVGIGDMLDELWHNKLRNAFSHAQYVTVGNGTFLGGQNISPLTASAVRRSDTAGPTGENPYLYRPEEVEGLYKSSLTWLRILTECYKESTRPFKDGQFYRIPIGPIRWNEERGWWDTR